MNKGTIKPKCLFVDDDNILVDVLRRFIGDRFHLDWACNGKEAFIKAEEYSYDIFLIDIKLPGGMNGLEVTKNLKKIKNNKDKPFIAITAYAMRGDKEQFLANGMTHYISKPFEKQILLDVVNEALRTQ